MSRVLLYPFAGAACGVLAAVIVVPAIGGNSDGTLGVTLVVGTFLAGAGAVAGAILGAAEMFIARMDRTQSTRGPDMLETDALNPNPHRE